MYYSIFYLSGLPKAHKPITANLHVTRDGLKLFGWKLPWKSVIGSEISYEVTDSPVSAGKAVAGAILAGGIGAVVGGALGGNKVKTILKIAYSSPAGEQQLVVTGQKCEQAHKAIEKRLAKSSPTVPKTPVSKTILSTYLVIWKPYIWAYKKLTGKQ